jgi:uncharacterized membrane protein
MSVNVRPPQEGAAKRIADAVDRIAAGIARHWLAFFNIVVALFIALPFVAPVLMHVGATGAGTLIYKLYSPTCHQLPERSIFLFGPEGYYSVKQLEGDGYIPSGLNILQRERLRWDGSTASGWKVAVCERDVAIYGSILLAGLVYGLLRRRLLRRGRLPKMPLWMFLLAMLPLAIDGFTQLFGLRESTPMLRFVTGALMGSAAVWFAYPYVEEAMHDAAQVKPPAKHSAAAPDQTSP